MAFSEVTDFGRHEQKVSRVSAAATSSVRSFQHLIALGFFFPVVSMTLDRRALGITGNGNDGLLWYWDSHLVFTWCHLLWNHGDGATYKNPPVLLSCTYVGDIVSLVLSACCSFVWISCSISVVSTMLPFAVQTLGSWSAWCCLGARWGLHIPGLVWQLPCRPCLLLKRSQSSGFFPEPRVLLALLVMLICLPGGVWGQCDTQEVSTVDWLEHLAMQSMVVFPITFSNT